MTRSLTKLTLFSLVAATTIAASGCIVAVDDELLDGEIQIDSAPLLGNVEVNWTIDHSEAASLCAIYDIERWRVSLYGPESRETVVDCRAHYWSTENDMLYLPRGDYRLTVTALDGDDLIVGSVSTSTSVYRSGLERLTVNFDGAVL